MAPFPPEASDGSGISPEERYSRQIRFAPVGPSGQERLGRSSAVLVGCGALGASLADLLVRAGIGRLRIVDRDFVEGSNLQRQTLFEEADARGSLPKAEAARRRLSAVNSAVAVEAAVSDLHASNAGELLGGADLLLDGTDNFSTRYLLNDYAVERGIPWIYGGAVGASGLVLAVLPGVGACLRCLFPEPPPEGASPTCDTAGILAPAATLVASLQAAAALQILTGNGAAACRDLRQVDVWEGSVRSIRVERREDCPACGERRFEFLRGERGSAVATLCGRDAIQLNPATDRELDLAALEGRLRAAASIVSRNEFLLRFRVEGCEVALFRDGRALVRGVTEPARARALYSRYVGD
ncbi:MAG: ThiF family adenylyltransferase [Planctomycetes bacterium]|nr:ThiF family adenylyltransferase [Planctomycetota bacterium]